MLLWKACLVQGGSIPSSPLSTENYLENTLDGKPYDGAFWTKWSEPFGCEAADKNPFGPDKESGSKKFCRHRTGSTVPEAIQFRFCTLPDIKFESPFVYGDGQTTLNKYYSLKDGVEATFTSKFNYVERGFRHPGTSGNPDSIKGRALD